MANSILQKLFGSYFKSPAADAPGDAFASSEQDVREYAARAVAEGFDGREALCDNVRDAFEGDAADSSLDAIPEMIDAAIAAHRRDQQNWPIVTDCDKLDAAFAALEDEGIVARHHFTCCGTCGAAEIGDEIDATVARGHNVEGYTFYHMQDTERAVEGGGLYLNYGSVDNDDERSVAIGRRIARVMLASGLEIDWDGSLGKRIGVTLDWKRRRTD
jgi:hypothetical protein